MKKSIFSLIAILFLFTSCGPSAEEKERIAAAEEKEKLEQEEEQVFIDILNYISENTVDVYGSTQIGGAQGSANYIFGYNPLTITIDYDVYIMLTQYYNRAQETGDLAFLSFDNTCGYRTCSDNLYDFSISAQWLSREGTGNGTLIMSFDKIDKWVSIDIFQGNNANYTLSYQLSSLEGILKILHKFNRINEEKYTLLIEEQRFNDAEIVRKENARLKREEDARLKKELERLVKIKIEADKKAKIDRLHSLKDKAQSKFNEIFEYYPWHPELGKPRYHYIMAPVIKRRGDPIKSRIWPSIDVEERIVRDNVWRSFPGNLTLSTFANDMRHKHNLPVTRWGDTVIADVLQYIDDIGMEMFDHWSSKLELDNLIESFELDLERLNNITKIEVFVGKEIRVWVRNTLYDRSTLKIMTGGMSYRARDCNSGWCPDVPWRWIRK